MARPDQIAEYNNNFTKRPYSAGQYSDMRGVVDFGNLAQFAPYEGGYCFLAVINGPHCMQMTGDDVDADMKDFATYTKELQDAFIKVLENEFRGLDGIEDITTETMDITDNVSTLSLISKTTQTTNSQITMRFTEKTGSLLTKYISTFLKMIKDTKSTAKTYGGIINANNVNKIDPGPRHEVFNMLYIVTDATCLRIEKAFLLLNAQPTTAAYGELYQAEKGGIEIKELSIPFNAFVVDGAVADRLAKAYMETLINTTDTFETGKINVNSWNFNWSFAGEDGDIRKVGTLTPNQDKGKFNVPTELEKIISGATNEDDKQKIPSKETIAKGDVDMTKVTSDTSKVLDAIKTE